MAPDGETRIKVFVSYSRADKAFASDLVLGLAACGFAPYIDRQDIAAGEDWEKRLEGLIAEADSIVCIVSPDSLASDNCAQELRQALELRKRILPVVWRPVDDAHAPPEMKRLNYIFFSGEGRTFAAGLSELASALRTDIGWIREHTRLAELAGRWASRGRPPSLLLRGDDIDAASSWLAAKPITAPPVTDNQADFIKASADARAEADRKARGRRNRTLVVVSMVALAMTGLAGVAGLAWQEATGAEARAVEARDSLQQTNASLEEANLRLNANVGLRFGENGSYYSLPGRWFSIAAQYSGAVAWIERKVGGRTEFQSGFVLDGALINTRYAGEPLLLTFVARHTPGDGPSAPGAQTVIANSTETRPDEAEISVTFPAIAKTQQVRVSERVWRTPPQLGGVPSFEVWRLADPLPRGARAVRVDDVDCGELGPGGDTDPGPPTPLAMFGVLLSGEPQDALGDATLFVSTRLNRSDPYSIRYTHSTGPGTTGAAVFDLTTGKIAAIHLGAETAGGRLLAHGIAFRLMLDIIRGSIKDANMPPVCGA